MAKKIYFRHLIEISKNKTKMTWNILNNVIGRAQNSYPMNPFFKLGHEEAPCNEAVEALNDYFFLVDEQYGFRKGLSTEYAAHSLTNSILTVWKNKFHVGGIFCNLTKAFDCVDHNILKMKLQYDGLHKETINWFESYLSCRKQRVRLQINRNDTYFSAWKLVK
jgi:hypothetical protein